MMENKGVPVIKDSGKQREFGTGAIETLQKVREDVTCFRWKKWQSYCLLIP